MTSKRPGRSRAASISWGLLVAASSNTPGHMEFDRVSAEGKTKGSQQMIRAQQMLALCSLVMPSLCNAAQRSPEQQ